ncbi:hypothetical protein TcBrA4_0139910 [Trypanosoma cruzi]|nr:hypothetical protein TcBrA4_0139910 [Trypanosoma cruzi]
MRGLLDDLVKSKELDEQRERAAQQLEEKKTELEGIREEVYSMRRLLERKEKQLEKEKPVDELLLAQRAETSDAPSFTSWKEKRRLSGRTRFLFVTGPRRLPNLRGVLR